MKPTVILSLFLGPPAKANEVAEVILFVTCVSK